MMRIGFQRNLIIKKVNLNGSRANYNKYFIWERKKKYSLRNWINEYDPSWN